MVNRTDPFGITSREVIVHCYQMSTFADQSVEVKLQNGDEGFSLTSAHFRDLALVKDNAADDLDVIGSDSEGTLESFADNFVCFGKDVIETLTILKPFFKLHSLLFKLFVGKFFNFRLKSGNRCCNWLQSVYFSFIGIKDFTDCFEYRHKKNQPSIAF